MDYKNLLNQSDKKLNCKDTKKLYNSLQEIKTKLTKKLDYLYQQYNNVEMIDKLNIQTDNTRQEINIINKKLSMLENNYKFLVTK